MSWTRRIAASVRDGVGELRAQPGIFFGLCALATILMFTYGLARPPVKSLFTEVYGADNMPWAMLAVAGTAIVAAAIYGRFAARVRASKLFFAAATVIAVLFVILRLAWASGVPHALFLLYVLMETYIVVLVESFWTLANLTYDLKSARVAYGLFCASGSIGAGCAEFFQRDLAASLGTENVLWLVVPVLLITGVLCMRVTRDSDAIAPRKGARSISYREGWKVVTQSKYLLPLLLIVASSQIVINVVDYQLTDTLETMYPGEDMRDQRTGVFGQVYFTINVVALILQMLTGPILGALGIALVLVAIPGLVTTAVTAVWAVPRLATSAAAMVTAKAFDYSLFRAAKEMLYLPLSFRAKTVGKTMVDMNTYRAAKAGASVLLLALIPFGKSVVLAVTIAIAVLWLMLTLVLVPRYLQTRESAGSNQD
ncbi:MAG: hypothetical protein KJO07_01780 [Deltaproteobacteria bacterium]|nr:hypothetical protein [Deltaproteobacteria bacterium]